MITFFERIDQLAPEYFALLLVLVVLVTFLGEHLRKSRTPSKETHLPVAFPCSFRQAERGGKG